MRKMRKTLITLTVVLSSCVSQQPKCPDDEELLRAGLRIYAASEMIDSDKGADQSLARRMYGTISECYFACSNGDRKHKERHYIEAKKMVSDYLGLASDQRKRASLNIEKIREETDLRSYIKK